MRVLHVDGLLTLEGGVGQYIASLAALLDRAGHDNLTLRCIGGRVDGGYLSDYALTPSIDVAEQLQAAVRDARPDVVLLHHVDNGQVIEVLADQVPTVAYVHGFPAVCPGLAKFYRRNDAVCERAFGWGCFAAHYLYRCSAARNPRTVLRLMAATRHLQAALRKVQRLMVGSEYMRALLIQNGFEAQNITVLAPHFLEEAPGQWTPPVDPCQILFAGRIEVEKGLSHLLQALIHLPDCFHLVVAGEGTLRPASEALVSRLGLANRVSFLGWCEQRVVKRLYPESAVIALPSICPEPFGKVGIEAMAQGRPVVAFDVGGISDWLHHGETGLLVHSGDTQALARALERILIDPRNAEAMGRRARQYVETAYDSERHLAVMLKVMSASQDEYGQKWGRGLI